MWVIFLDFIIFWHCSFLLHIVSYILSNNPLVPWTKGKSLLIMLGIDMLFSFSYSSLLILSQTQAGLLSDPSAFYLGFNPRDLSPAASPMPSSKIFTMFPLGLFQGSSSTFLTPLVEIANFQASHTPSPSLLSPQDRSSISSTPITCLPTGVEFPPHPPPLECDT